MKYNFTQYLPRFPLLQILMVERRELVHDRVDELRFVVEVEVRRARDDDEFFRIVCHCIGFFAEVTRLRIFTSEHQERTRGNRIDGEEWVELHELDRAREAEIARRILCMAAVRVVVVKGVPHELRRIRARLFRWQELRDERLLTSCFLRALLGGVLELLRALCRRDVPSSGKNRH